MATKIELEAKIDELEAKILDGVSDEDVQALIGSLKDRTVAAEEKVVSLGIKLENALSKPVEKQVDDPKPDCFGNYPESPEDVTRKCRICKICGDCKASSENDGE